MFKEIQIKAGSGFAATQKLRDAVATHASTVVETTDAQDLAFFGGTNGIAPSIEGSVYSPRPRSPRTERPRSSYR